VDTWTLLTVERPTIDQAVHGQTSGKSSVCDRQPPDVRHHRTVNGKRQTSDIRLSRPERPERRRRDAINHTASDVFRRWSTRRVSAHGETTSRQRQSPVIGPTLQRWRPSVGSSTTSSVAGPRPGPPVAGRTVHLDSDGWRTAKLHNGDWVSGPSALMTSYLRLQDLSACLSLSLCLSIAGLTSPDQAWTPLACHWSYRQSLGQRTTDADHRLPTTSSATVGTRDYCRQLSTTAMLDQCIDGLPPATASTTIGSMDNDERLPTTSLRCQWEQARKLEQRTLDHWFSGNDSSVGN